MRTERALLRIGEYLVRRACRRLPPELRDERHQEWAAELPAILHDCEIRLAPHRAVRMLGYAADTLRGAALTPGSRRRRSARLSTPVLTQLVIADVVAMAWSIWDTARAPGHWGNYAELTWSLLLLAWLISQHARPTAHTTLLIAAGSDLALLVLYAGSAAQAPRDWVNYVLAAWFFIFFVVLVAWRPIRRWADAGGRNIRAAAK